MQRGLVLFILFGATLARADVEFPPPDPGALDDYPVLPHDTAFMPRYRITHIEVQGNRKTKTPLILRELALVLGDEVAADDGRVELSRLRLLALGYFLDVHLSLEKGEQRGQARLLVEVEERGTLVLDEVFLGSSQATDFWGGLAITERNLLGQGISLGGGLVGSTRPLVPGAVPGYAATLRLAGPPAFFPGRLDLQGSLIVSRGSEFFRTRGDDSSANPENFVSVTTRRTGGTLGLGWGVSTSVFFLSEVRYERLSATWPDPRLQTLSSGQTRPLDFLIKQGQSQVGSLTLTLDWDTRSDPVLPRGGSHLAFSVEVASPALISSYRYLKGTFNFAHYQSLRRGHVLGFLGSLGAIAGSAPYFDHFFVGDINSSLPQRALGLNYATEPAHDFLGTGSAAHRYEKMAARGVVEYAIPLWKRHGLLYRGDAFLAFGMYTLCDPDDFGRENRSVLRAFATDLTADVGIRLDTSIGIFTLSVANAIGRISY